MDNKCMYHTHLKDGEPISGEAWVVEWLHGNSCHQPCYSQHTEVPVVGVAEEQCILVGVDQVEYDQPHHFTHKQKTDCELEGGRGKAKGVERNVEREERYIYYIYM